MSFKTRLTRLGEQMERFGRKKPLDESVISNRDDLDEIGLDLDSSDVEGDDQNLQGAFRDFDERDLDTLIDDPEDDIGDDAVDRALEQVIAELIDYGTSEDKASDLVYETLADLVDEDSAEDTPDGDAPDAKKAEWIANTIPKIKERLYLSGALGSMEADDWRDV